MQPVPQRPPEGLSISPSLSSPHQPLALCAQPWVPLEMPSEVGKGASVCCQKPTQRAHPGPAQGEPGPGRKAGQLANPPEGGEGTSAKPAPGDGPSQRAGALAALRLPRKDAGEAKGAPLFGWRNSPLIHPWGPLALRQGLLGTHRDTEGLRRGFSVGKREEERLQLKIPGFQF